MLNKAMPLDWFEYQDEKDLPDPNTFFYLAGKLKANPNVSFVSLFYIDDLFKVTAVDPEFFKMLKPSEVKIEWIADMPTADHPEDAQLADTTFMADRASDYLTAHGGSLPEEAYALIEDLITVLE